VAGHRDTVIRSLPQVLVTAIALLAAGCSSQVSGGGGSPSRARAGDPARSRRPATARRGPRLGLRAREAAAIARFERLHLPVYCGGSHRYVAFTFDDGPGVYTKLALKVLRRFHIPATFFLVGRNLDPWRSALSDELAGDVLGDHTWTHPYLPALAPAAVASELARTQQAIEQRTGRSVVLFRPPYGARNAAVDAAAWRLGLIEVLWNVDSADSLGANYAGITRNVRAGLHPGAIVLLHENRGQTIRALRYYVLPALHRSHLRPVTVPELLALDPPTAAQLRAGPRGCRGTSGALAGG
jgi:peptidoglycan/xylan/chitin deacetylase (PgdA/CDA1 family)